MKRQKIVLVAFLGLSAIQLCAPLSMIAKRELTLRGGEVVRFRTAPVDPYDAFRGRYVVLGLEAGEALADDGETFRRDQKVFVRLKEDDEGFARYDGVTSTRPSEGAYVATRVRWYGDGRKVHLRSPCDRYYLNERDAPAAEAAYRRHSRRGKRDAYVAVRVLRGNAVIEELYVGDKPILQFIQEEPEG